MIVAIMTTALSGTVWAETAVLPNTQALTTTFANVGNDSHIKIKTSSANSYTNPLRFYANVTITIQAVTGYAIQSVTYEASSTGNYVTNAQNATVTPAVTPVVSEKNVTWTLQNASEFTFTPSAQTRANSITITYVSTGSSLEDSDLALTGAPVALSFDLYNNASPQTVSFTSSSTGAVTVSESNYVTTSVSGNTITVTPVKVTPSEQTITVSQAADDTYEAGEKTFTVSITDSTPFSGGDVIFVAGTDVGTTTANNSPDAVTKSGVTMSSTDAAFATEQYRFYANSTTTFSTSQGTITKIVFTNADQKNPCSNLSTETGSYSDNTWTGNATSVAFAASAQARASQVTVTVSMSSDPIINAENTSIAYDVTSGLIAYTITNPVAGTSLTASTTAEWLTLGTVSASAVSFTCSANEGSEDRTATVTLTYGEVTKTITVTQAHPVVDYATLPFVYDGNGAMLSDETGVTVSGLGAYTASPAIKFDSDGDYFFIKINERPGKLTFDIKCNQSEGVWEGTFKVQTSTDGETYTDAASYTDLTTDVESKTINNLPANARYIKFIYAKTTGNVALGNINLAAYSTAPELEAENVEIAYDNTSGSIAYEIINPVTGGTLSASTDADWLTLGTVGATVPFTCAANTAASIRTATVTLTYTYGSESVTKVVTVTQAGNPNALQTIAEVRAQGTGSVHTKGVVTSVNGRTGYIQDAGAAIVVYMAYGETLTVGDEIEVSGTLTTYSGLLEIKDPTVAVLSSDNEVAPEVMTVAKVNSNSDTKQGWLVKINAATVTAIDGQNVTITQYGNNVVVRFNSTEDIEFVVDDIISLTGNIGCFNTTQIANPTDVAVGEIEVTIGSALYTTFVAPAAVSFPENLTAYIVTAYNQTAAILASKASVPAGTPVVVKATAKGTYTLETTTTPEEIGEGENLLKASDGTVQGGANIYALANKTNGVGFYPVSSNICVSAGKAYLEVTSGETPVKGFYGFEEDDPTGIDNLNLNVNANEGAIYNLSGQMVNGKLPKGIYIVNGKKILK